MTQAWIAGKAVTACKSIICRSYSSSIRVMGERVQLHEYIHPDACFALFALGYPSVLCPACSLVLDVLNRERAPAPLYAVPR